MSRLIIVFLILASCTFAKKENVKNDIFFDESLTFDEFKSKLIIYGNNSNYQKINKNK